MPHSSRERPARCVASASSAWASSLPARASRSMAASNAPHRIPRTRRETAQARAGQAARRLFRCLRRWHGGYMTFARHGQYPVRAAARAVGVQFRNREVDVRSDKHGRSGCRRTVRLQHHLIGVQPIGIDLSVRPRKSGGGVFELLARQCEHDAMAQLLELRRAPRLVGRGFGQQVAKLRRVVRRGHLRGRFANVKD